MKKTVLPIFLLACLQMEAQVWTNTTLPEYMNGLAITTHGNKIFMAGNGTLDTENTASDRVFIYDAATGNIETTHLTSPREAMAAVTVGDKVMFAGGTLFDPVTFTFSNTTDTVEVYDVPTGEWSVMKLSAPRRWITAKVVNGKVYFAGGREPSGPYTDVLDIYDPASGTWSLDTLALPVRSAASAVAGDLLLLFLDDKCQILNTLTGEWEVKSFVQSRGFGRGVVTTPDEIWFVGGSTYLPIVDIYNKADGTWSTKQMDVPRYYPTVCLVNGKIIIAGGDTGTNLTDLVETFNTETGEWEELALLSSKRCYMNWEGSAPVVGDSAFFPGGLADFNFTMTSNVMDIYSDTSGTASGLFIPLLKNVHIQTFPSPFTETLQVEVDFSGSYGVTSGTLEVLDLTGRQLFLQNIDNQQVWSKSIASQGWAPGAYLLKVRTQEGVAIRKVLKH